MENLIMIQNDIHKRLEEELKKKEKQIVNKNAVEALLSISSVTKALSEIFYGREKTLDNERNKLMLEGILSKLIEIDNKISDNGGEIEGINWGSIPQKTISGKIEAYGEFADDVTGVTITPSSGSVELKSGTHITASGNNVRSITGLKIG
jgi:hypothetical protein